LEPLNVNLPLLWHIIGLYQLVYVPIDVLDLKPTHKVLKVIACRFLHVNHLLDFQYLLFRNLYIYIYSQVEQIEILTHILTLDCDVCVTLDCKHLFRLRGLQD